MFFQKNLPSWERALRVLAGLTAAIGAFALPLAPLYQWLAAAGGAAFAATGFVGFWHRRARMLPPVLGAQKDRGTAAGAGRRLAGGAGAPAAAPRPGRSHGQAGAALPRDPDPAQHRGAVRARGRGTPRYLGGGGQKPPAPRPCPDARAAAGGRLPGRWRLTQHVLAS